MFWCVYIHHVMQIDKQLASGEYFLKEKGKGNKSKKVSLDFLKLTAYTVHTYYWLLRLENCSQSQYCV